MLSDTDVDPVDWRPWNEETFATARDRERPLFLVIGYPTCGDCRALLGVLGDGRVAAFLNTHFLPVWIDREERPDLDGIYLRALLVTAGEAGWPAILFLLPDLRPFAGTTWRPEGPDDTRALLRVLEKARETWVKHREAVARAADQILINLAAPPEIPGGRPGESGFRDAVREAVHAAEADLHAPPPSLPALDLLAAGAEAGLPGAFGVLAFALRTLEGSEPVRLCDLAQILALQARASELSEDPASAARLKDGAERTAKALLELGKPGDEAGRGGFGASPEDPKRVAAWNGLAIGALALAGRIFGEDRWIDAARAAAEAALRSRGADGTMPRLLGSSGDTGVLDDTAAVAAGLLHLRDARPDDARWADGARALAAAADLRFHDPQRGGYFRTSARPDLVARRKELEDTDEPSGSALMAQALGALAEPGSAGEADRLSGLLSGAGGLMRRHPLACAALWATVGRQRGGLRPDGNGTRIAAASEP